MILIWLIFFYQSSVSLQIIYKNYPKDYYAISLLKEQILTIKIDTLKPYPVTEGIFKVHGPGISFTEPPLIIQSIQKQSSIFNYKINITGTYMVSFYNNGSRTVLELSIQLISQNLPNQQFNIYLVKLIQTAIHLGQIQPGLLDLKFICKNYGLQVKLWQERYNSGTVSLDYIQITTVTSQASGVGSLQLNISYTAKFIISVKVLNFTQLNYFSPYEIAYVHCQNNHSFTNGKCQQCFNNCQPHTFQIQKLKCESGVLLFDNKSNICRDVSYFLPHCRFRYQPGNIRQCLTCTHGYYKNNAQNCESCLLVTDNCVNCSTDGDKCNECISPYYLNQTTNKCQSCSDKFQNCINCTSNGTQCIHCKNKWFLNSQNICQSCAKIQNCQQCLSQQKCSKCGNDFQVNDLGQCYCLNDLIVTNTCTNIQGCISSHFINGIKLCLACQSSSYIFNNFYCYKKIPADKKCANSIVDENEECDDGNRIDGDGCSLLCTIEQNYQCLQSPSLCTIEYIFSLQYRSINRLKGQNNGKLQFLISPPLTHLSLINITKFITINFSSNVQYSAIYNNGIVTVLFSYTESLNNKIFILAINFTNSPLISQTKYLSFSTTTMHPPLTYNIYLSAYYALNIAVIIGAFLNLLLFFISLFFHKLIGIQIIHSLQSWFFIRIVFGKDQPHILSVFSNLKYLNGYNNIFQSLSLNEIIPSQFQLISQNHYFFINLNLILLPMLISLIVFLIQKGILKFKKSKLKISENRINQKQTQFMKFKNLIDLTYEQFLFPTSIGVFMPILFYFALWILNPKSQQKSLIIERWIIFGLIAFMQFFIYFEIQKGMIYNPVKVIESQEFYFHPLNENEVAKSYISIHLCYILSFTFCTISCFNTISALFIIFGLTIAYTIYLAIIKPYTKPIHNYGALFNQISVVYFVGCMLMMRQFKTSELINVILSGLSVSFIFLMSIFGLIRLLEFKNVDVKKKSSINQTVSEFIINNQTEKIQIVENQKFKPFIQKQTVQLKKIKERLKMDYRKKNSSLKQQKK